MSSTEGTEEMGEAKRRTELLNSPVDKRVMRCVALYSKLEEGAAEETAEEIYAELYVVGASVVADVLSALVRVADALESLASAPRAGAGVPVAPLPVRGDAC